MPDVNMYIQRTHFNGCNTMHQLLVYSCTIMGHCCFVKKEKLLLSYLDVFVWLSSIHGVKRHLALAGRVSEDVYKEVALPSEIIFMGLAALAWNEVPG